MPYLYASLTRSDENARPVTWTVTHSRDSSTFGVHTSCGYFAFDRETAEAMIRHLEIGISGLEDPAER